MGTLMQVGGMVLIGAGTLIVVSLLCRFGRCPFGRRLFRKG